MSYILNHYEYKRELIFTREIEQIFPLIIGN